MLRRILLLSSILCFMVVAPDLLSAQIDTGGITGTVTDSAGAVVPGVTITLTNNATGVALSTKTTSTGTYSLNAVRPGTYTLRGEAAGFQTFNDNGLEVHLQSTLTIDIPLVPGAVKQQVTVTAAAPLLQAENAAVGQTVTSQTVNDLPLNGRDWASLAQLAAGTTTAPVGQPSGNSGSTDAAYFSVDGVNLWQNDFRLNGINDNIEVYGGSSVNSNAAITPPPDAIQEFKLQNGNFNAEFGHSTGAVINAAIKSGTNQIHGDVWEYFRNTVLDANIFFKPLPTSPVPAYHQNQFGATIGGPVVIPKIYNGRDKTFFFVDYQGDRLVTPAAATSTVPTQNMINSGFTNLQDLLGYGGTTTDDLGRKISHGTILDPATTRAVTKGQLDTVTGLTPTATGYVRDPFYTGGSVAGITDFTGLPSQLNILPAGRIDPNAVKLLGLYPAPIKAGLTNNFAWTPSQDETDNSFDIRIDEAINQKHTLFGVYDRSLITRSVPSSLPGLAVGETGGRNDSFPAYAFAVGYNAVLTPTLVNEMHVGMVHADKFQKSIYGNTFGIPAQYGIGGIQQVANNGGIPPIVINGLTHIGVGNYTPTIQTVYSIEGSDSVTKVLRNHTFKTGVQVDDLIANISQPPAGRGTYTFTGAYTDVPNVNQSLNGIADMLVVPTASAYPTSGGVDNVGGLGELQGSNISGTDDQRWYTGAFFQDDWKVTPSLTLNLGLRWDYFTPYAEVNGRQANFIPSGGGNGNTGTYYMSSKGCQVARSAAFNALLTASSISLDCVSGLTLGQAQKLNFAPRVGFAYRVTPTLVVRGGYGPAYGALGNLGYGGTLGTNYPFVYAVQYNSPDSQHPLVLPGGNGQTATLENSLTTVNLQDPTINAGTGLSLYGRQYKFQTPYVQTINLTVQDQFTNHDSIQIGYVGTMGRHLDNLGYNNSPSEILPQSANAQNYIPFKSFARNATYETTNASSSYNALQTTYEHQLGYGLTMLANYTWSKCMTDQHTQAGQNQQYRAEWLPGFGINADYALCDTDAANVFHLSGSWQLPVGRGKSLLSNSNRAVDAVLGGWAVNFIYGYQTGQPFTINCPVTTSAGFGCFANKVPGQSLYAGPHNYKEWLNPNALAQPAAATAVGQLDYSVLGGQGQQARGPDFNNLDSSIFKYFNFTETVRMQFRAEAFNTTNTPQFAQPGTLNFETVSATSSNGFSSITGVRNNQRLFQFALKLFY
jgi:Carboxypeptidase regulatory-like domain